METIKILNGDSVIKLGSDYTAGRIGYVEEIKGERYRVRWILEKSGNPVNRKNPNNGLRTWINRKMIHPSQSSLQGQPR